jgi:hypothetical protein
LLINIAAITGNLISADMAGNEKEVAVGLNISFSPGEGTVIAMI